MQEWSLKQVGISQCATKYMRKQLLTGEDHFPGSPYSIIIWNIILGKFCFQDEIFDKKPRHFWIPFKRPSAVLIKEECFDVLKTSCSLLNTEINILRTLIHRKPVEIISLITVGNDKNIFCFSPVW